MNKVISCGVIIIDKETRKLLACHPSMKSYREKNWDIAKGHVERNETHVETALRELKEETGIILKPDDLYDCGMFLYTKYKDLHLYVAEYNVDITKLKCSTYFNFEGRSPLEVDDYRLINDTDTKMYYHSLGPLVEECVKRYKEYKNEL